MSIPGVAATRDTSLLGAAKRLDELRSGARESLIQAALDSGDPSMAITEAESLVAIALPPGYMGAAGAFARGWRAIERPHSYSARNVTDAAAVANEALAEIRSESRSGTSQEPGQVPE